jgi:MYXO-CTERM domain-containing protein
MSPRILAAVVALGASTAFAGVSDGPFTFVSTQPSALEAAGFTNLTAGGPLQSSPTGTCAGCYTLPTLAGPLPLKAFFQFEVVGGMPTVNDGAFAVLTFDFANPNFGVNDFINIVNGSAAEAYGINYNPNPTCSFADFLDPSIYNAANTVVFRWDATPGQSVFTFGWDFTGGGGLGGLFPGMTVTGGGGVPAPGALALVGATGLFGRRRRR